MTETAVRSPRSRTVYIQTFGCQMNEYDSAKLLEQLRGEDYVPVGSPRQADLILVNTCAIREKSEHKVYSLLGELGTLKRSRPGVVIGVGGCVAQQRGEEILKRAGEVDLVFGTDNLFELPGMLADVAGGQRPVRTEWNTESRKRRVENFVPDFGTGTPAVEGQVKAHLAITKGCNNFCTFCVVPHTRGGEVSREADDIVVEATRLAAAGVKEITLLGQNVNSYRANGVTFVELLHRLHEVPGLERLRYTSPHPKDFDESLARAHRDLPRLCEHLHLPFQSGSSRILKAMRRDHRIELYLEKIALVKAMVPDIAVSTDIIVGFPGETDEDFEATLEVMRQVRFDQVYGFKFSPRSQTPAADFPEQVPERVRAERLAGVFELYERILQERNGALVGSRQQVLLEGAHPRDPAAMVGRTRGNKSVMVMDSPGGAGDLVDVSIVSARKYSLVGTGVSRD